ncbi:MAG TPA: phosphoribosylamine--glycine ligase [Candidatus Krumholzibacteria bacterium]|nr:phosphoribosylamine--glycine ligase [Candidatus Krumholzibacteria bacterium]
MRILVLGSGAREHALAAALAASRGADEVFVAPGNDGILDVARPVALGLGDLEALAHWARRQGIGLVVAGSEDPLVRGAWNIFDRHRLRFIGPSAEAARLEGSKAWAKEFMGRHAIPTAPFSVHEDFAAARAAAAGRSLPFVIKADGLAAGKGVFVVQEHDEAVHVLRRLLVEGACGDAGRRVVLEDLLVGEELSVFVLTDGYNHRLLGCAQDHKRAFDGDRGPNTGGMGAYSPVPHLQDEVLAAVESRILAPTLAGMLDEGQPYRGFLYLGLMLTTAGPQVLEYNCRLGDPEAQVLLPRLRSDFLALLLAAAAGDVTAAPCALHEDRCTVGVVVASEGYPEAPQLDRPIHGLEAARELGVTVFAGGVRRHGTEWLTSGGRIVTVVGSDSSMAAARERAYAGVGALHIPGSFHRKDIALRALERASWQSRASAS